MNLVFLLLSDPVQLSLISEFRGPGVNLLESFGFLRCLPLLVLLFFNALKLLEPVFLVVELHNVADIIRSECRHSIGKG